MSSKVDLIGQIGLKRSWLFPGNCPALCCLQ